MPTLLEDITSRDPQRIWASSGAIIHLRDPNELSALADALPEIKQKTQGIALGGALIPNSVHLNFAIRTLEFYQAQGGCLCTLYPEYLLFAPRKEEEQGNVRIVSADYDAEQWMATYVCECAVCGRVFQVEQGEYHYTWWSWKVAGL